jgi:hypothetical protein
MACVHLRGVPYHPRHESRARRSPGNFPHRRAQAPNARRVRDTTLMRDHYAAPKTAVDDGVRERGSWRNAAIAFGAGLAALMALFTLGFYFLGGWGGWAVLWRWQVVAIVPGPRCRLRSWRGESRGGSDGG